MKGGYCWMDHWWGYTLHQWSLTYSTRNAQDRNSPSSASSKVALLCCLLVIIFRSNGPPCAFASINIRYCFESGVSFIRYLLLVEEEGSESSTDIGSILMIAGTAAVLTLLNRSTQLLGLACRVWATSSILIQPYMDFYCPMSSCLLWVIERVCAWYDVCL